MFELNNEQLAIKAEAHKFAKEYIKPLAEHYDEIEEFPFEIVEKAHSMGFTTMTMPKEFGGEGMTDPLIPIILSEEFSWACAGINTSITCTLLPVEAILQFASEEQKKRFIEPLTDKSRARIAAMALTEESAGSDVNNIKTCAEKQGNYYILNGSKKFITNGGIADLHIIFAKVNEDGTEKIVPFVLEDNKAQGFTSKKQHKMGVRASHTAELYFDNVRIPVENRLDNGKNENSIKLIVQMLNKMRPIMASAAVGLSRAALEYATEYASKRIQYGIPIISNQGISFTLADMATKIEAARLLTWRAALSTGQGKGLNSSMAKLFCGEIAMDVTQKALQILGGNGYMKDRPLEKWMRDAKIYEIWEGTSEMQKIYIANCLKKVH